MEIYNIDLSFTVLFSIAGNTPFCGINQNIVACIVKRNNTCPHSHGTRTAESINRAITNMSERPNLAMIDYVLQ